MIELQPSHSWRFSLRTLLFAMVIAALAALNWKLLYYLGVLAQVEFVFWPVMLGLGVAAWCGAQTGPLVLSARKRSEQILAIVWITLWALIFLYWLWVRSRWHVVWYFGPKYSFPYPDEWLIELHNWLDRRDPAPPGVIKLRGEIPKVYILVNYSAWFTAAIWAFSLGLLFRIKQHFKLHQLLDFIAGRMRRT
ncbi:MAG: hypothetical protein K8T89_15760 [Planctomycetes bacterium]|nr:hypothetical protein [Planctomycetota bacterium]